jgi:hypothetical protein
MEFGTNISEEYTPSGQKYKVRKVASYARRGMKTR